MIFLGLYKFIKWIVNSIWQFITGKTLSDSTAGTASTLTIIVLIGLLIFGTVMWIRSCGKSQVDYQNLNNAVEQLHTADNAADNTTILQGLSQAEKEEVERNRNAAINAREEANKAQENVNRILNKNYNVSGEDLDNRAKEYNK